MPICGGRSTSPRPITPHPNPRVGCVVVARAAIVGEGAHRKAGTPHAEMLALEAAGSSAFGSDVYVTLEPCNHTGRTRPCTDVLIRAGVAKVIVATIDPDPRVSGSGIRALEEAGIEVELGVLEDEAVDLDLGYHHHRRTGRPYVHVVLTQSVPGGLGEKANADLDYLRSRFDHVVGGEGDLLHHPDAVHVSLRDQLATLGADGIVDLGVRDDPALTVALSADGLIDRVTMYTANGRPDWGPLGSGHGFTITNTDTIGPETRHDARKGC